MDFSFVEFPCTVDLNTFQAYIDMNKCKLPDNLKESSKFKSKFNGKNSSNKQPKSLRHLILNTIVDNWLEYPIYKELPRLEDRNYILSKLDVNHPLQLLSQHIHDDYFWRKCYQQRWKTLYCMQYEYQPLPSDELKSVARQPKPWISIYMERHLQDFLQNLSTSDYDTESVQEILDICAEYINQLEINYLQAKSLVGEQPLQNNYQHKHYNDHIPFDYILSRLKALRTLRLTYCTKTIGTNYYLGCNRLSEQDAQLLAVGLRHSFQLRNFCFHNTKLYPQHLELLANSLCQGCPQLTTLTLPNCSISDKGLQHFLYACHSQQSFANLKYLDLTNNKISSEGIYLLSQVIPALKLEYLSLHSNPIANDGFICLINAIKCLPLKTLDVGACSLTQKVTRTFMALIIDNKTLCYINISNNNLQQDFGKQILKVIGLNKNLKRINLNNTGLTIAMLQEFRKHFEQMNKIKPTQQK